MVFSLALALVGSAMIAGCGESVKEVPAVDSVAVAPIKADSGVVDTTKSLEKDTTVKK